MFVLTSFTYIIHIHVGYACEMHDNPADHFLDVITTCEEESRKNGEFPCSDLVSYNCMLYTRICLAGHICL